MLADDAMRSWQQRLDAREPGQRRLTRQLLVQMDAYAVGEPLMIVSIAEVEAVLLRHQCQTGNTGTEQASVEITYTILGADGPIRVEVA